MEKFAKDGYLEKQAFLLRADARQVRPRVAHCRVGRGVATRLSQPLNPAPPSRAPLARQSRRSRLLAPVRA